MKCPNCGAEIESGSLFCPECGAKLENKKQSLLWIIVAVVAVVIIGGIVFVVTSSNKKQKEAEHQAQIEKVRQDSINAANLAAEQARLAAEQAALEEQKQQLEMQKNSSSSSASSSSTKGSASGHLSYGTWSGSWKNGQPDGMGTMRYTESHIIDKRDRKKRTAVAGDYVVGEFVEGKLVQGVWYDSSNNVKESIMLGI